MVEPFIGDDCISSPPTVGRLAGGLTVTVPRKVGAVTRRIPTSWRPHTAWRTNLDRPLVRPIGPSVVAGLQLPEPPRGADGALGVWAPKGLEARTKRQRPRLPIRSGGDGGDTEQRRLLRHRRPSFRSSSSRSCYRWTSSLVLFIGRGTGSGLQGAVPIWGSCGRCLGPYWGESGSLWLSSPSLVSSTPYRPFSISGPRHRAAGACWRSTSPSRRLLQLGSSGASLGSRRGGQLAEGSRCPFDRAGAVGHPYGVVQGRGSVQQADTRYVGTLVRGSRAPSVPLVVAQHGKRRSKMVNHRRMAKPSATCAFECHTWWALRDSNPRPQPCEGCALTS